MKCSPTDRGAALTQWHPSSTLDRSVWQALCLGAGVTCLSLCELQVTAARVPEYIDLLVRSRLGGVLQPELAAVLEGMEHLMNDSAMKLLRRWATAFHFEGPVACCSAGEWPHRDTCSPICGEQTADSLDKIRQPLAIAVAGM